MIDATTKTNDLILVPFSGAGTECVAALKRKRKFIAFETDPLHLNIANKRIQYERNAD